MEHFITSIIRGTVDQRMKSVHRRFVKFSKGEFPNGGPVLQVSSTKQRNLTMNGSFEYEDLVGYYVATQMPSDSCKIGGSIYTQPRVSIDFIQDILESLSLGDGWEQGKRDLKNLFVRSMNSSISKKDLVQIYDKLAETCYLLFIISPPQGKLWEFKCDDKIPPLKKTFGKAEPYAECKPDTQLKCKTAALCEKTGICIKDRTKFCRTKTGALDDEEFKRFKEIFLPDFPKVSDDFSELLLVNKYTITNLIPDEKELLENKKNLTPTEIKELREKIKKVGFIERIVYIDDEMLSNKVEFTV